MDGKKEIEEKIASQTPENVIIDQTLGLSLEVEGAQLEKVIEKQKRKNIFLLFFGFLKFYFLKVDWFWVGMWTLLVAVLIYSRVVGWDWGLPYHMHPDERNMAVGIMRLECDDLILPRLNANPFNFIYQLPTAFKECWNPKFFAYGQFPLYLGKMLISWWYPNVETPTYTQAVWSLRVISISSSILTFFISLLIVKKFIGKKIRKNIFWLSAWLFVFVPYAIQFSHFGTTESLMMFAYTTIAYLSLIISLSKNTFSSKGIAILGVTTFIAGIAVAAKVSSLLFLPIVIIAIFRSVFWNRGYLPTKIVAFFYQAMMFIIGVLFLSFVFSPQNFISWSDFVGTINYESSVGTGASRAFYTRQFEHSLPILFQIKHIFPYVFGIGQFGIFILGLFVLSGSWVFWFLIMAISIFFLPSAFLYAKWTRFIAPIFPLMSVLIVVTLIRLANHFQSKISSHPRSRQWVRKYAVPGVFLLTVVSLILPGIAYLKIYQAPDVRYIASKWLMENLKDDEMILSETANVVDMPIGSDLTEGLTMAKNLNYISFPSYDVEVLPDMKVKLAQYMMEANWIFIPSRRVVANHTCWDYKKADGKSKISDWSFDKERCTYYQESFPTLNDYYEKLYTGQLPFEKVAEFSSYPRIEIFGKVIYQIDDEKAEETWTVFDHPVARFYRRK